MDRTCEKFKNMINKETLANNQVTTGDLGDISKRGQKANAKRRDRKAQSKNICIEDDYNKCSGKRAQKRAFKAHKSYKN